MQRNNLIFVPRDFTHVSATFNGLICRKFAKTGLKGGILETFLLSLLGVCVFVLWLVVMAKIAYDVFKDGI